MKKITPDPPVSPLDAADSHDPLLDRIATERALNYYLQNHKPFRPVGTALYAIPDSVNSEAALARARLGVVDRALGGAGQGLCR